MGLCSSTLCFDDSGQNPKDKLPHGMLDQAVELTLHLLILILHERVSMYNSGMQAEIWLRLKLLANRS
jgi:hypothetical protein